MSVGERREARERALSLLYEAETKDVGVDDLLAGQTLPPDPFAVEVVRGIEARRGEIEALVARFAPDWPIERMPVVDRNLLRLAIYELLARPGVPVAVILSEAVALAGEYSTDESSRFVNGVLAAIAREVRDEPLQ